MPKKSGRKPPPSQVAVWCHLCKDYYKAPVRRVGENNSIVHIDTRSAWLNHQEAVHEGPDTRP